MGLEDLRLFEMIKREKDKYQMISFMWNPNKHKQSKPMGRKNKLVVDRSRG